MSACKFSIPVTGSVDEKLRKAKSVVQSQGGQFNGDANSGEFQVSIFGNTIAGTYSINNGNMDVDIISKPFMVPCSTIEGFLKGQLNS